MHYLSCYMENKYVFSIELKVLELSVKFQRWSGKVQSQQQEMSDYQPIMAQRHMKM